ncbi:MAG TPA: hypothetical protein VGX23_26485 [Actinocrinis sp.]|nr:hypothetical protein [Actinocrinis sp.]
MGDSTVTFRAAGPHDVDAIAALHADSWRRHYRGAFADSYLDGDVLGSRREVWAERLLCEPPGGDPSRLNGQPAKFRIAWPDVRDLLGGD